MKNNWKALALGLHVRLWTGEENNPAILVARAGEDHEKLINQFREDQKGSHVDTTLVAVLTFHGLPPRPEYLPED